MAEGDGPQKFKNKEHPPSDDSDADEPVKLDLINLKADKHTLSDHNTQQAPGPSQNETMPRREENPFSFKHFLQNDKSYQNQGARPKVYCEGRAVTTDLQHSVSESSAPKSQAQFSSALPDFVQDHLVIEQCYLGNPNHYNLDVNNLPDFTLNRGGNANGRVAVDGNRNAECRRENVPSNGINIPLDLPVRPQAEFPLDLPISESQGGSRSCPSTSEVGNSKSLPDFLADGAVRTQSNDGHNSGQSPERDVDRLRQELDLARRQLVEQNRRADYLSRELEIARNKEHEYTQNLAKALEQVEENLERSNMRAASSENAILKLRQEVKSLNNEINVLRRENRTLRGEEGAIGGPGYSVSNEMHTQRLAHELRQAANTAEHSLRQLLNGVENLRILASSVESFSRIEERADSYHSDAEDDTGPAL